nr:hypothetical protein B456_001G058000 [Gossypium raimondii]KJB79468.1 hypothetical protein B456_013G051600 [Gossypium raimondii]
MRFRPNLVISGGEPYAEDGWRNLRIGNTYFSVTCVEEKAVLSQEAYILLYAKQGIPCFSIVIEVQKPCADPGNSDSSPKS